MEELITGQPGGGGPEKKRPAVDEASFLRYYETAMKAASMAGPMPSFKERVIPAKDEASRNVLEVVFGDTPLGRMTIAIKNQMAEEEEMDRFPAVFSRILALIALMRRGSLKQWALSSPHDPRQLLFPDAVVFAAAVAPLDDLTFEVDQFEQLVHERMDPGNPRRFVVFAI